MIVDVPINTTEEKIRRKMKENSNPLSWINLVRLNLIPSLIAGVIQVK